MLHNSWAKISLLASKMEVENNNAEKNIHWYVKSQFLSPTQYKAQIFLPSRIFFFVVLRKGQLMIKCGLNFCYISYSLWTTVTKEETFLLLRKFLVSYLTSIYALFTHRCSLTPSQLRPGYGIFCQHMYPLSVYSV